MNIALEDLSAITLNKVLCDLYENKKITKEIVKKCVQLHNNVLFFSDFYNYTIVEHNNICLKTHYSIKLYNKLLFKNLISDELIESFINNKVGNDMNMINTTILYFVERDDYKENLLLKKLLENSEDKIILYYNLLNYTSQIDEERILFCIEHDIYWFKNIINVYGEKFNTIKNLKEQIVNKIINEKKEITVTDVKLIKDNRLINYFLCGNKKNIHEIFDNQDILNLAIQNPENKKILTNIFNELGHEYTPKKEHSILFSKDIQQILIMNNIKYILKEKKDADYVIDNMKYLNQSNFNILKSYIKNVIKKNKNHIECFIKINSYIENKILNSEIKKESLKRINKL